MDDCEEEEEEEEETRDGFGVSATSGPHGHLSILSPMVQFFK